MRMKTLLWWFPAAIVAIVAVTEGGMQMGARAARRKAPPASATCLQRQLTVDLDGDGRAELVKLVRVGNDAWADVWSGSALKSSTRVGSWREDAALEAIDVNGDGKIDLVRRWTEGPEQHAQVWLSDGAAFDEGWSGVTANTCMAQR
ncbi:MAG: hypothetical protein JWN44_2421 [Myxococcales bacterium]|nr:hypothetical protein [Myxococcales bacterium]